MYDLISLGTVVIDLYFRGDSLTTEDERFALAIGGKYFANHFYEGLGGGATNVAIGCKKQGLKTSLAATIGDNVFKKVIQHKLNEIDLDHNHCIFQEDYYNISAIMVAASGDRSIINYRSPRQDFYDKNESLNTIANTKSIYMANLHNFALDRKTDMLRFFKSKEVRTYTNLGVADARKSFADIRQFLHQTDVLIINCHEFAEMVRKDYEDINFKEYVKETYLGSFENLTLILTDGIKGSYGYSNGEVYHQPSIKAEKVVDATGAGDAYTAGFISNFNKTDDIKSAMEQGAKYSAKIVGTMGSN